MGSSTRTTSLRESLRPSPQPVPQAGDLVVTRESRSDVRFTLRQFPGAAQLTAPSRDKAVRLVRGFAQKESIDIWYCINGRYRLLEAYRCGGSEAP